VPTIALLCTDGSEPCIEALRAGLALLAPPDRIVVATADPGVDPMLVAGASGFSGAVLTPEQYEEQANAEAALAAGVVSDTIAALGIAEEAESLVVPGDAVTALIRAAEELPASVIVAGTHGRGGLKRALLGSVSDHLVRHAPCPVLLHRAG
jgi:nucleotide-binding universal stress UspA family protein